MNAPKPLALVVDDSRVVRTVSRKIMENLGFEVIEAENGKDAVARCKERVPKIVLLDWNMPVMDGMEFLLAFRQVDAHMESIVIMCTTENDMSKIMEAMSCGANEYVMKPFDEGIIKGKLQQLGLM